MTNKVLTFGEIMLRISPWSKEERMIQTDKFKVEPGGSESNVAVNLANLGNKTTYLTKLPKNQLAEKIIRYFNKYDVDTSNIIRGGKRLGTYWTEHGVGPRASNVIYDRANSVISNITVHDIDFEEVFTDVDWFHTSGITPALSEDCMKVLKELTDKAFSKSINISMDLNYRSKLWNWIEDSEYTIDSVMSDISEKCTLLVGNESDFQDIFNVSFEDKDRIDRYSNIAQYIFDEFAKLEFMAVSLRDSISASENKWSGLLFVKEEGEIELYQTDTYHLKNIVDRVGGGDSFASGIIHGLRSDKSYQKTLDFAVAFSALKHTIRGDVAEFCVEDVGHLLATKGSGKIVR